MKLPRGPRKSLQTRCHKGTRSVGMREVDRRTDSALRPQVWNLTQFESRMPHGEAFVVDFHGIQSILKWYFWCPNQAYFLLVVLVSDGLFGRIRDLRLGFQ